MKTVLFWLGAALSAGGLVTILGSIFYALDSGQAASNQIMAGIVAGLVGMSMVVACELYDHLELRRKQDAAR